MYLAGGESATHFRSLVAAILALGYSIAGIVHRDALAGVAGELEASTMRGGNWKSGYVSFSKGNNFK